MIDELFKDYYKYSDFYDIFNKYRNYEREMRFLFRMIKDKKRVLDLGCGSGAIGLTLKSILKDSEVTLVDISKEALEVAKLNANNLNLDVTFIESDWFSNVKLEKYDIIVSNPPYSIK